MYMEIGHNFRRQEIREKVCGVSNRPIRVMVEKYFLICTISRRLMDDSSAEIIPRLLYLILSLCDKKKHLLSLPQSLALSILLPSKEQRLL